jgi:hypothetical protein
VSDFVEVFGDWLVDGTSIETLTSTVGIEGRTFAAAVAADGLMIEMKRRMVRGPDGVEVLSERTLYVPAAHVAHASFTVGSRVTFADGAQSHVLALQDFAAYGVVDHLVVACE